MIVTVITICYNEAKFLPFFLSHWLGVADVIVCFDGMSTDGTREQLSACPQTRIVDRYRGGLLDDAINMEIKSTAYLGMESDWFIVTDFDELVYTPGGVRAALERHDALGATVAWPCEGWNMIADEYPDPARPITSQVKQGVRHQAYDKIVAFKPCVKIQYGAGAHDCQMSGRIVCPPAAPRLKLLHYKFLGEVYVREKAKRCRLSERNHEMKWGYVDGKIESRFTWVDAWREGMANRVPVIE